MHAPTLWEEGRWSGSRVTRFSIFACALLACADVVLLGHLDPVFDSGFIVLCVGLALAVRPRDLLRVGVLPPLLLLGLSLTLSLLDRSAVARPGDGLVQTVITVLADHAGALLVAEVLTLLVLAIRVRATGRHP